MRPCRGKLEHIKQLELASVPERRALYDGAGNSHHVFVSDSDGLKTTCTTTVRLTEERDKSTAEVLTPRVQVRRVRDSYADVTRPRNGATRGDIDQAASARRGTRGRPMAQGQEVALTQKRKKRLVGLSDGQDLGRESRGKVYIGREAKDGKGSRSGARGLAALELAQSGCRRAAG